MTSSITLSNSLARVTCQPNWVSLAIAQAGTAQGWCETPLAERAMVEQWMALVQAGKFGGKSDG